MIPQSDVNRAGRLPLEWRGFGRFLRAPVLPDRAHLSFAGSARAVALLFVLDMLLMAVVLAAMGSAIALGFEPPEHLLGGAKLTPLLIAGIVIAAPLGEEMLFRGWLSGRPGHVLAVLALLAGAGVLLAAEGTTAVAGGGAALLIALAALYGFRRRGSMGWFQRHFGWFYYASALLFAAVHLTNFAAAEASPAVLGLIVPQFVLGLLLGYLRVNRGLLAGSALHILHNGVFVGVMLLGSA